jgi:hypothetical protein
MQISPGAAPGALDAQAIDARIGLEGTHLVRARDHVDLLPGQPGPAQGEQGGREAERYDEPE